LTNLDGRATANAEAIAGATSTGQTAYVMATGLTTTQQVHATRLDLLDTSNAVTRAMATGATSTGQTALALAQLTAGSNATATASIASLSAITNSIPMSYINPVTGLVWLAQMYGTGTVTMCRRDLLGGSFTFDLVATAPTSAQQVITLTITNGLLASTTNTLTTIDNRGVPPNYWYGVNITATNGAPDNLRLNIGVAPR
jgi:hypothetical protein